jgi:DNA (cytosine-5)-methyltransferase 1
VSTTFVSGPSSICFRDRARAPRGTQVVDLFCGSGGMSLGFAMNGYRLVGGADIDEVSVRTYGWNLALAKVVDIRVLAEDESELKAFLASLPAFDPAAPTVLVGCPPCQGFTAHRKRRWAHPDPRNDLVSAFARVAVGILPDAVVMENVPELLSGRYRAYFDSFRDLLDGAGYTVRAGILNAAGFGVPQERFRAVVIAMRHGRFSLPAPRLGPERYRTVRDAIADLPPVRAGESHPSDPMHRSAAHRSATLATIRAVPRDGGSRPTGVGPACLDRVTGFYDVYGRLHWDRPSITITHYARNPASGRFVHPEQDRGLTMREAARLQGFPDWIRFEGSFDDVFRQIGEAVPPPLARGIAEAVSAGLRRRTLRGAATETTDPVSDSFGGVIAALKMRRRARPGR